MSKLNGRILPKLVLIFFGLNAVVYLSGINSMPLVVLLIFIGFMGYVFNLNGRNPNMWVYLFGLFIIMLGLMSILYNGNMRINELIKTILYLGIALIVLNYRMNLFFSKLLFYTITFYFLINLVLGISATEVIKLASRNFISVLMLVGICLVYIALEDNNKPITIIPSFLYFLISIWATGRSGIISSGLLLTGICLLRVKQRFGKKTAIMLTLCIILIITISYTYLLPYFTRFQEKGFDSPRFLIWSTYFTASTESIISFILGPPISNYPLLVAHEGNLHNSFLQMHAFYGIVFILFNIFLLTKATMFYIKNKHYSTLLLLIVLLLRASTDKLFFSGYCEPLLFYFEFFPYFNKSRKSLPTRCNKHIALSK